MFIFRSLGIGVFIKKILVWLIKRYSLNKVISDINSSEHIKECNKNVLGNNVVFYPESNVYNTPGIPELIRIANGAHIRGTLLVLDYGGAIEIGENCYIGDASRIWSGDSIKIGNNVLISHNVNIIDTNSHEIDSEERTISCLKVHQTGPLKYKGSIITSPIIIEDNVWINFNAVILKGVKIGQGSIIAAGCVVTKDVPAWTVVAGNPAKIVKRIK